MQANHASVERFSGFADCYQSARPHPPEAMMDVVTRIAGISDLGLVVDIGSGTGLSTRIWADRAREVIGVEPNADMRRQAEQNTDAPNVSYREGVSTATGLSDGCADVVTCVQAMHWMEPEGTLAEVARILRSGGVFATVDCDWPPIVHWEIDLADAEMHRGWSALRKEADESNKLERWSKSEHLRRIRESGLFRYTREVMVHQVDHGDADRYIQLIKSFGSYRSVVKRGYTDEQLGFGQLRATLDRVLGDAVVPWYYTYRIRLGVR